MDMIKDNRGSARSLRRAGSEIGFNLSFVFILVFFALSGLVSYRNIQILTYDTQQIARTHGIIITLGDLLQNVNNAETGQRGFVLTGDEKYLAPYNEAVGMLDGAFASLAKATVDEGDMASHLDDLHSHINHKMAELRETVDLRRQQGFDAALAVVKTDRGRIEMDAIRSISATMKHEETDLRNQRLAESHSAYRMAVVSAILTSMLGIVLSLLIAFVMRRAAAARRRQEWLQNGRLGLATALVGDLRMDQLGDSVLAFLSDYLGAHAGAFFIKDGNQFKLLNLYGALPDGITDRFMTGEGLLGRAAKDARAFLVHDVPAGYLNVGSAFGRGAPRHLAICPALADGAANAVMELGFLTPVSEDIVEFLGLASDMAGVAVKAALYRAHLQNLLEETQRQSEELQVQSEELRVSNEELEEQSQALKASQARLEQQQAELEQTNSHLENQMELLAAQKEQLEQARVTVQAKAQELERASQYKSDFLANMSHELRTPLNSSLIMAKLLADNAKGNLSDEQVKYAQIIQSSGNDLLSLINDILDLSKIEAGHMEIAPDTTWLSQIADDMMRVFQPVAQQKNLVFSAQVAVGCPKNIVTDRMRLEQILKNLLSNALKFTEKGRVDLNIATRDDGRILFTVTDTGIGIAPEQQQAIFDAFRQADGTISRKFGGTGLGLSISRELARMLGGHIELTSQQGQGSNFSLVLPAVYDASAIEKVSQSFATVTGLQDAPLHDETFGLLQEDKLASRMPRMKIQDDRGELNGQGRLILIVEDEEAFAGILRDLVHEQDFQCLIASTAEDALMLTRQYMPSAVVLDVGLPDHSGLLVLDRLKRDTRTRHIPVHVVSAGDYAKKALSLGAIGYMLKPVKRDDLADALRKLETRLSQRMRRVLIVEDDDVQRDSVGKLLMSRDVEPVGVGTAAECLEKLKETTFDCMVLDLSLPDASGYALLETLDRETTYSFPPVIVYTGRDLSAQDEERLRRYSKSIIIKGAKSPERLLDEVTLFLHQVVSELPVEQQKMLEKAHNRDTVLEDRHILIVEDDIRNVYALTSIFEPLGAKLLIARNGIEALKILNDQSTDKAADLVLMDVMMPEMDGLTATREIRKNPVFKKLPIIMLTAKAMKDDQERCIDAGANDYMAKPLDVDKLLSLVRVWMPR